MDSLNHFIALARAGEDPAGSRGEHAAALLARRILEAAPGLDAKAIDGATTFLEIAARFPNTAERMLRGETGVRV